MGEYEPEDSRNVTQVANEAPGEPPRTGPREGEARAAARVDEKNRAKDKEDASPTMRNATGEPEPGFGGDDGGGVDDGGD